MSPYLLQDIRKIEKVQKHYTKFIFKKCNLSFKSYSDRLFQLNMHSLEYRRIKFDLVFLFKIIHGASDLSFHNFLKFKTRTHLLRSNQDNIETIFKSNNSRWLHSFFARTSKVWNKLPNKISSSSCLTDFKTNLDNFDLNDITPLNFP